MEKTFEEWLKGLEDYSNKVGWCSGIVSVTGKECWRCFFEDGYTPKEAFAEDMQAGV